MREIVRSLILGCCLLTQGIAWADDASFVSVDRQQVPSEERQARMVLRIDGLLRESWKDEEIRPAGLASDGEFLASRIA